MKIICRMPLLQMMLGRQHKLQLQRPVLHHGGWRLSPAVRHHVASFLLS